MKRFTKSIVGVAAGVVLLVASSAMAQSFEGRWDARITINGTEIPFRLDLSGQGADFKGTLHNGDQTQTTSSAKIENGTAILKLEHYLTTIETALKNGQLDGRIHLRGDQNAAGSPFHATRYAGAVVASANPPVIDGVWEIPYESQKGEKAWRFIVRQSGAEVQAAILRVDGDTGALTGTWQNGKWVLSHFDGSRPLVLEVAPGANGTLDLLQRGGGPRSGKLTAYRPADARTKGLPEPADYTAHTTVRDSSEVFAFKFPDVNGKLLSNEDPKFKGKVVLAIVTGTWCPNCHDEAQYLVQLYKKYRDQGLEIVALDFEEPEQQDELARVKAFTKRYGVEYTYLIAGAPVEMWEKVPQAVNLNTWPATFFVGRDGRVKHVHAGFAAPASGEFNAQLQSEFTSTIERLLSEGASTGN